MCTGSLQDISSEKEAGSIIRLFSCPDYEGFSYLRILMMLTTRRANAIIKESVSYIVIATTTFH